MRKSILFTSLLAAALCARLPAQNNPPVLTMHRASSDAPAVLEWTSRADGVYRVEYSADLASWLSAQDDLPSQGTTTFWTDYGSDSTVAPRASSMDPAAPYRFYRVSVQRYTINNSDITVQFNNVTPGVVLAGPVTIEASAISARNLNSGRLYVDGEEVALAGGTSYSLPLETRFYPNGTHRLSVIAEDDGDNRTTGEDSEAFQLTGSSYGVANVTVTFDNFLSNVRLRHKAYRPDLGQFQEVYGTWASPRLWRVDFTAKDDPGTIYRSFTGDGTRIYVSWDGTDSNGQQLPPQIVACEVSDLGPGTPPAPPGGQNAMAPSGQTEGTTLFPSSLWEALMSGLTSYFVKPPPMPPVKLNGKFVPWEEAYGPLPPTEVKISEKAQERFLVQLLSRSSGVQLLPPEQNGPEAGGIPGIRILFPYKPLGFFGILHQGHHPLFNPVFGPNYPKPRRGPGLPEVTFSTSSAFPWGGLRATHRIGESLTRGFPAGGYPVQFAHEDDACVAADLLKPSLAGNGLFNTANISLFVGHSAACKEPIVALGHPQSYIPIYTKASDTFNWVGMFDMDLGSPQLKWAAFYTCNLFRDELRPNPVYTSMKNLNHLAMNEQLHIMQAYATEMSVHPDFLSYWPSALFATTPIAANHTVLGAWRYVCVNTQPKEPPADANVSRSIYWEECVGDYLYGYGPQTDPDPLHIQVELLEDDQVAPSP